MPLTVLMKVSLSFISLAGAEIAKVELPKCCPSGQSIWNASCTASENPVVTTKTAWKNQSSAFWPLHCLDGAPVILNLDEFELVKRPASQPSSEGSKVASVRHVYEHCFDFIEDYNRSFIFVCFPPSETKPQAKYYRIGIAFSILLMVFTFLTYAILPSLRNLHGYCLMLHIASMIFGYTVLLAIQIFTNSFSLRVCTSFGFAVQFFFLATFFWLNVMCIDIYWAFSGIKLRGTASERDRKKLLAYSFYAWGMPLIILAVTVGVDYSDSIPSSSIFKPNMGKDRCFFKGRTATWTYFYGPMAVILFSNLILFSITAYRIWRHRRETAQSFHRGDSRRHDGNESERFNLYLKLFLVMGINWISELISFMFGKDVPQYLWYITDITNTLQGVFIFLIFVWKKRVRKLLWEKLCGGKQSQLRSSTMTTSTALNSSTR
ncbi:G-protein coupled receptor Mth2-like isoform X4 [Cimex lectularius]|uniref:G-protein coupled receptors family 2 profile 2 domain-containing protein n=1 Tax=Cimex lectularius TaxID=79782 RepID=A0A8I6TG60_CIMLE|nr:G-protein coupled receptor Mth2-like isoform X4 [Cimex lectularius]